MHWLRSHRFDQVTRVLADQHYNRQKVGSPQFAPPGRCIVFRTPDNRAFWVSSWPKYARHDYPDTWNCTAFRNDGTGVLSSLLIREAVAATRFHWPSVPEKGIITFVDPKRVRHKRDPGRCFIRAGFRFVGVTKIHKHLIFQMLPSEMPAAERWCDPQFSLAVG